MPEFSNLAGKRGRYFCGPSLRNHLNSRTHEALLCSHRLMRDTALCHKIWMESSQKARWNELYSHLFLGLVLRTSNLDVGRSTLSCLAELWLNVKYLENFCVILSIYDTFNDTGSNSDQGCANPGRLRFFTAGTNIFGPPVWNCLHVTRLAPRILRWLLHFWNVCTPLAQTIKLHHPTLLWLMNSN